MRRWRLVVLLLTIVAFGLSGLVTPSWFSAGFPLHWWRTVFFWVGVVGFLAAAWGQGGT
ncbi:MAG TPA: hypothetical protein VN203_24035 [Candidatus Acidoferrum sp.]|nr:hypothetical protein [Candidatus Acidoferrum sp.]